MVLFELSTQWEVKMAFLSPFTSEPVLVGRVGQVHFGWMTYDDEERVSGNQKAFIVGMHTLCPVFEPLELSPSLLEFEVAEV